MKNGETWDFRGKTPPIRKCSYCPKKGRGFFITNGKNRRRIICGDCLIKLFDKYLKR